MGFDRTEFGSFLGSFQTVGAYILAGRIRSHNVNDFLVEIVILLLVVLTFPFGFRFRTRVLVFFVLPITAATITAPPAIW